MSEEKRSRKLHWSRVIRFKDGKDIETLCESVNAHNEWIKEHDVDESEITSEQDREQLDLLAHAIDEGGLFDDEFNRYELCMKQDGYGSDHWKSAAKNGLVNVIPHCSNNSFFHHVKCSFCDFDLRTDSR